MPLQKPMIPRTLFPALAVLALACGGCRSTSDLDGDVPGGYSRTAAGSREVRAAAEFAVAEQSKGSRPLKLVEVASADRQVVSGMNYRLTLKVRDAGKSRDAVAVVWWQAWNMEQPYRLSSWEWR